MKNKYYFRARISERQFRHLLRLYCADVCALTAARLAGVNQNTAHQLYTRWRTRVCALTTAESPPFTGEVEVDESYFGPGRVRGKRGRGGRWQDPDHRPAQARRSRLSQGRAGLFPRGVATHHPGPGAGPPHHLRRRLALLRRPRARRLPPSSHPPARQPVCPGQKSCERHRVLLELRQAPYGQDAGLAQNPHFLAHLLETQWRWNQRRDHRYKLLLRHLTLHPLS